MREIKFRAWDKENKIMQNVNGINFLHNFVETYNADEAQEEYFDLDDCELMRYTGLKDRNGNEIYEGDILSNDEEYYKVVFEIASYRAEIEEYSLDLIDVAHCCEVIGNIYENPELLGDDEL